MIKFMARPSKSAPSRGNPNWKAGGPSPNPAGRRGSARRFDGWQNIATALGTHGDKRVHGGVRLDVVSSLAARNLWRGNDVCKRIVELVPNEAMRRGFKVKTGDDREVAEEVEALLEAIPGPAHVGRGANNSIRRALHYQRAYGGAAIFPVINDGAGSLLLPLDKRRIQRVERLQVYEPRELFPLSYYSDPMHPKFGEPEIWQLRPMAGMQSGVYVEIHETRLIAFPGSRVSRQHQQGASPGWGDSIFTTVLAAINDFELTYGSASALIQDFAQAVLKLKDLASVVGTSPKDVHDRLEFMNLARSTLHALVLDSEDDFERKQTPLTGLPDIMDRMANRVAMSVGVPVTILMGQAPAGLNATGDADTRAFYATADLERSDATPMVEQLVELVLLSADGPTGGDEPDTWSIDWPPLWTPTEKEVADARYVDAQADDLRINNGTISADDAAESHFPEGGDGYNPDIHIDWKKRRAQAEVMSQFGSPQPGQLPGQGAPPKLGPDGKPLPQQPQAAPAVAPSSNEQDEPDQGDLDEEAGEPDVKSPQEPLDDEADQGGQEHAGGASDDPPVPADEQPSDPDRISVKGHTRKRRAQPKADSISAWTTWRAPTLADAHKLRRHLDAQGRRLTRPAEGHPLAADRKAARVDASAEVVAQIARSIGVRVRFDAGKRAA